MRENYHAAGLWRSAAHQVSRNKLRLSLARRPLVAGAPCDFMPIKDRHHSGSVVAMKWRGVFGGG